MKSLFPHEATPGPAGLKIAAEAVREGRGLTVSFALNDPQKNIVIPKEPSSGRHDGLWKTTCLEVFLRPGDGPSYLEFNVSPAGAWAAYRFSGYREGMEDLVLAAEPDISVEQEAGILRLSAALTVPDPIADLDWTLGLSAVIEEKGGLSYWALAHPPGQPDFHHSDCFTLRLGPKPAER